MSCCQNWIDNVLCDSFPASDPPSWIPSATTPAPAVVDIDEGDQSSAKDTHAEIVEEASCSAM